VQGGLGDAAAHRHPRRLEVRDVIS
jgi:hypothetical protein